MNIIMVGAVFISIAFVAVVASNRRMAQGRRRKGIPRPTIPGVLGIIIIGLVGLTCGGVMGGRDLIHALQQRSAAARRTQTATATVTRHACLLTFEARDTALEYSFQAPDPATGQLRTYQQQERVRRPNGRPCAQTATPYGLTIWYDPAHPGQATAEPPAASSTARPLMLFGFIGGCFGLLPLMAATIAIGTLLRRLGPEGRRRSAEARQMEADGFMVALNEKLVEAVSAARTNPGMARYVREYNGRLYFSLDFIEDPAERDRVWNALWRVQGNGWQLSSDAGTAAKVKRWLTTASRMTEIRGWDHEA